MPPTKTNQIKLGSKSITYTLKKSKRAKNIRLSINSSGHVNLTLPWYIPKIAGTTFIKQNQEWIFDKLKRLPKNTKPTHTKAQITALKIKTRELARNRLEHFNLHYQFKFNRITIRNQKTRWGSCSSNKTLSFNYKLALLPKELSDYIIVHELCHLKEMNHSHKFWSLVAQKVPNHKALRRKLKSIHL